MHTYIVYHRKTGKIVHVHHDTGEVRRKPDDVLKYVHPSLSREELAAIQVDAAELAGDTAHRVNPKTKRVEPAKVGVRFSASASQLKDAPKPFKR
jgi:hypothetical protein